MARINIQFTRFSAFYSPLFVTKAGGFLAEEGLEPEFSLSAPGVSAIAALQARLGRPWRAAAGHVQICLQEDGA